jgi:phosphatidylserine decarboxylase
MQSSENASMDAIAKKTIKREQFRQAKRIHGGLWKLFIALAGVKLARLWIPTKRLRLRLYRGVFNKKYPPGLDETEAEKPLWMYPSLNALFTRGIKPEFRPIAHDAPAFLSPCDGTVQDIGRLKRNKLLTVKGIEYTLDSLLPRVDTSVFENGHYAIVFLSPIDCHRIFSPQDGRLEEAIHVPGYRLPVHPPCQRAEYPVYALNERMILRLTTPLGPCLVVLVAGWGVGNIRLPAVPGFQPHRKAITCETWSQPIDVKRGDWIATFELGSTAVLVTPPARNLASLIDINQRIKYGQPVFSCAPRDA